MGTSFGLCVSVVVCVFAIVFVVCGFVIVPSRGFIAGGRVVDIIGGALVLGRPETPPALIFLDRGPNEHNHEGDQHQHDRRVKGE